jgi:spore coat polysaccharide biosynthesis predicted glycosyltransferase SpsG
MRFFLLTEVSKKIGLGHYHRVLTIYNELKSNPNAEVYFLIQSGDEFVSGLVGRNYDWRTLLLKDFFISKDDVVVIDSYHANGNFFSNLFKFTQNIWYIDDFVQLDLANVRIINPSLVDNSSGYKYKGLVYSGPSFVSIKPEIRAIKSNGIKKNGPIKLLIYLGGAQAEFDLSELLSEIVDYAPDIEIHFISIVKVDTIDNLNDKLKVRDIMQADALADFLKTIDIAIVASGQIIFELIFLSIPFIAIKTSQSQLKNIQGLKTLFPSALVIESKGLNSKNLSSSLEIALSSDYYQRYVESTLGLLDGLGLERILSLITGQ